MDNGVNWRRLLSVVGIITLTVLITGFFCLYEKLYIDEWICLGFLDVLFLMLFIFELTFERANGMLSNHRNTNYVRIFFGFLICCIISGSSAFLPMYAKPVMVLVIIMYSVSNEIIAVSCGSFFSIILTLTVGGDFFELSSIIFLILTGAVLAQTVKKDNLRRWSYILVVLFNIIIPVLFYYWGVKECSYSIYLYGAVIGVGTAVIMIICNKFVRPGTDNAINNALLDIIDEEYVEVIELKAYSMSEYSHAKKVSEICYECAKEAKLNENICLAAGFYYRLGKWLGDDYVNLGVKRAKKRCFPESVILILEEYYGEQRKPTTPESALVHIVDFVVKKIDGIHTEVGKSKWNNEMIIYQTLNELSSSGIYDESGLGMNHFLKIRDCIAREVIK